jgi:hypothetical protein
MHCCTSECRSKQSRCLTQLNKIYMGCSAQARSLCMHVECGSNTSVPPMLVFYMKRQQLLVLRACL